MEEESIARNFGRSLRIPDASLKCMEQSVFLFSTNQESTEIIKGVKNIVKDIFHYALPMKQKNSGSICRFHGPKTTRPLTMFYSILIIYGMNGSRIHILESRNRHAHSIDMLVACVNYTLIALASEFTL